MKFKSSTLAVTDRAPCSSMHKAASLLGALILVAGPGSLFSQSPSPTPAKKPTGYLRFWNLAFAQPATLELTTGNAGPQDPAFLVASPSNFYADYRPIQPGTYQVKICKSGDRNNVIKAFSLPVRDGTALTIIAQDKDGHLSIEASDDTYDPDKTSTARLTVRNFFPNAKVVITVDGKTKTDPIDPGEVTHLDDLPSKAASLTMAATATNGQVYRWSTGVDLATSPHATVLVLTDGYGRFRPRVAIDGQPPKIDAGGAPIEDNGKSKQ